MQADSGMKFDQGRVNRILALIPDLNDLELSQLIHKLGKEREKRIKNIGNNTETTIL